MRTILVAISVLFIIIAFGNCKITQENDTSIPDANIKNQIADINGLVAYGEHIYLREGCQVCHTQEIEKETKQLVSLDGLGGKYTDAWLYYYLDEPQSVVPYSIKPSFSFLYGIKLEKRTLENILKERGYKPTTISMDVQWEQLLSQTTGMSTDLKNLGITTQNDIEALALIAYLQQIPSSKGKTVLESIEYDEDAEWEKILTDGDSTIFKAVGNINSIEKGKALFETNCTPCHGEYGQGIIGPNLTDEYWIHGGQLMDIARTIMYGNPNKGMISWKRILEPYQVSELVAYVSSLQGTNPDSPKPPQGERE